MQREREIRRHMGAIGQGIRRLDLSVVEDPRGCCSTPLPTLLIAIVLGLVAGKHSLAETERLTIRLSPTVARLFGIGG